MSQGCKRQVQEEKIMPVEVKEAIECPIIDSRINLGDMVLIVIVVVIALWYLLSKR